MRKDIEEGFMVFTHDGEEGIGAIREVRPDGLIVYVENAGEFAVPFDAITDVHSQKVIVDPRKLDRRLKEAIGHAHDAEDPDLAG